MVMLLNKILIMVFILSLMNIIRNVYFLIKSWRQAEKFQSTTTQILTFGLSLSYVIMSLFDGIIL